MQLIDVYLKSHINHIYLNDLYKKSGKKEYRRVLLEPSLFNGNRFLVSLLCLAYWIFIPLLFFKEAIHAITIQMKLPSEDSIYIKYFLLTMNASLPKIVDNAKISTIDSVWVVKNEKEFKNKEGKYISYFRYLEKKDILYIYIISLVAYYKSVCRYGIQVSILAKEAFDLLSKFVACSRLPMDAEYYFCNHMDRNAVLIDNLPHRKKILLQHGTMIIRKWCTALPYSDIIYNKNHNFWSYNIPYKYTSISKVYTFSEKEYTALCMSILQNKPYYEIVGYSLKTTPLDGNYKSVMIIGYYSSYAEIEEKLLSNLQNHNLRLFLKNHPSQAGNLYENMIKKYDFEFIDKQYFPAVDYVVSYNSTLALEYESVGTKVFYYDEYTIDQIVGKILKDE